jgi:hypothetical protein
MKFTRRKFIESSAMAALAAALGNAAGGPAFGRDSGLFAKGPHPLSYLKREHFEPFIGTSVRIRNDKGRTAVVLLREAAELKNQINTERGYAGESFRLTFESPRKTDLGQETYHFEHENLGRFSLFLVPIGGSGVHYEAIVNRIC